MTNIYALIFDTLSALSYPVREQGTYGEGEALPDTHATYFIVDSPSRGFADNKPTSRTTRVQIVLYSKDPAIKQGADEALKAVMLPAGFLRVGGGDLPFNEGTGHYAYRCDYRFYDTED